MVAFAMQQVTDTVNASDASFQIASSRQWCLHVSFSLKLPVAVWCYASDDSLRVDCSEAVLQLWQLLCQASMVYFRLLSHSGSSTLSD